MEQLSPNSFNTSVRSACLKMMGLPRRLTKRILNRIQRKASKYNRPLTYTPELNEKEFEFLQRLVSDQITMTTIENLSGTLLAAKYIAEYNVKGAYFECGVWRGGHSICFAKAMSEMGRNTDLYLLDTFEGMIEPSPRDIRINDYISATSIWKDKKGKGVKWCFATLEEVKSNISRYLGGASNDFTRFIFLKGMSQEVLLKNENLPESIAFLRLDTDWYESTIIELQTLWPRLVPGGVLVIDDYGYWQGQKDAVDEFFSDKPVFFVPLSGGARICQKVG